MLRGEQPIINGNGEQTRDFVYVDDVARANILAIKNTTFDSIFNIGTGTEISVNQIFNHIRDIVNPNIIKMHGPAKAGEQQRSVIDFSRAMKILNWEPEVLFDDGLRKTVEYFKSI